MRKMITKILILTIINFSQYYLGPGYSDERRKEKTEAREAGISMFHPPLSAVYSIDLD